MAVNTVAPGAIATDFSGGMVRDKPEVNKIVADMTALGRAGVPDDIGPLAAVGGQSLGQCPAHRGFGWYVHLACFGRQSLNCGKLFEATPPSLREICRVV
jgi:hypothetical protein